MYDSVEVLLTSYALASLLKKCVVYPFHLSLDILSLKVESKLEIFNFYNFPNTFHLEV